MTVPLREYLAQRRADIQANIKALRVEIAEIDAAEAALDVVTGQPPRARRQRGDTGTGKKTLKELALEALDLSPGGMMAADILEWIKFKHGLDVARESMSPQLSRLVQEGVLVRNGYNYRLAIYDGMVEGSAPAKEETPDVGASGASSFEDDLDDEIPF